MSAAKADPAFQAELGGYLTHYVGRPSPLYFAERLTEHLGGAKIYLKRDELNHTGAHKINNCSARSCWPRAWARRASSPRPAPASTAWPPPRVCARFGLPCVVYMGAVDVERQKPNVFRMKMLGAEVIPVQSGSRTLKDAMNEALRDWVTNVDDTFYCIGTAAGPHPYPAMVRDFQSVIGREAREQILEREGRLPDRWSPASAAAPTPSACSIPSSTTRASTIYGVEAAGHGLETGRARRVAHRRPPGVLHGNRTYLLQDDDGQITEAHSISAGLDYPGIGPEHSWLHDIGRVTYCRPPTRRRWTPSSCCRSSRASSRRWSRRHAPAPR